MDFVKNNKLKKLPQMIKIFKCPYSQHFFNTLPEIKIL